MSLSELVLFYSSASKASRPCYDIVTQTPLRESVKLVCLDSVEARRAAKEGKHFQIVNVPTLVLTFADGNLQLLVGSEKVMFFFKRLLTQRTEENQPQEEPSDEEETPTEDRPRGGKKKKAKAKKTKKNRHKEKTEIEFVGTEDEDDRPPPPPTEGLRVGVASKQKPGMSNLKALAQQMEEDRKASLGYDEKNLPRT